MSTKELPVLDVHTVPADELHLITVLNPNTRTWQNSGTLSETFHYPLLLLPSVQARKHGGSARRDMNGRLLLTIESKEVAALFALAVMRHLRMLLRTPIL